MNTKNKDVALVEEKQELNTIPSTQQLTPIEMMKDLKAMGLEVQDMKDMLALQKEYEANEALKQFNLALAEFKSEDILITKDAKVKYETDRSGVTEYNHATLGSIVGIAVPFLSKHGFSHRWKTSQGDGGITVTFILTHQAGHSEETSLFASPDNSGGKNAIQAIASTVTYLERYTFLAGTGLAVVDQDNDANIPVSIEYLSEDQKIFINDLIDEVKADRAKFLEYLHVESLDKCEAQYYDLAIRALEAKRK
jgi:hypothetical protein